MIYYCRTSSYWVVYCHTVSTAASKPQLQPWSYRQVEKIQKGIASMIRKLETQEMITLQYSGLLNLEPSLNKQSYRRDKNVWCGFESVNKEVLFPPHGC